jgi:hypothetical protein
LRFAVGFTFRGVALYRRWDAPLRRSQRVWSMHGERRVLLAHKIKGKSERQPSDLGLLVEDDAQSVAPQRN